MSLGDINSTTAFFGSSLTVTEGINNSFSTLTLGGTTSAKSLTSNGTVQITGSLTTSSANIYGGSIEGNGWTINGTVDWTRGTMSGAGTTTITNGGKLNLAPASFSAVTLSRNLTNNGTVNYTGSEGFTFTTGTLQNNGSFIVNAASGVGFDGTAQSSFINAGTFTKQDAFYLRFDNLVFKNSGTVNINAGTLDLGGGGTHTGDFSGPTGAVLQLEGIQTLQSGSDIMGGLDVNMVNAAISDSGQISTTGTVSVSTTIGTFNSLVSAGTLRLTGGTNNFNSSISAPTGSVSGGTLSGSGTWHVGSTLTWSGGAISGTGHLFIDADETLNATAANATLGRKLTNNGATNWTGGTFSMANGTFQNNGSFTADSATNQTITRTSGTNVFNNAGSFIKRTAPR